MKKKKIISAIVLGSVAIILIILGFYKGKNNTVIDITENMFTCAEIVTYVPNKVNDLVSAVSKIEEEKISNNNEYKGDIVGDKDIVIVIDPGHSSNPSKGMEPLAPGSSVMKPKDSGGATGLSGIHEYQLTQEVGKILKVKLEGRGYKVIMTKNNLADSISNVERAEVGNRANASLVIRLHADSFENESGTGATMLVPSKGSNYTKGIADKSSIYGDKILKSYCSKLGIKNRGLQESENMTGFNWSKVPVVLLEMGFMSSSKDDSLITNPQNYDLMVEGIFNGIVNCFS